MPFSIRQRVDLSDHARHFSLAHERPSLALQGLVTGIDNVRHDVWLSPKFAQTVRSHLSSLIAKYGTVQDIAAELTVQVQRWQPQRSAPLDFKQMMAELLSAALHRAKAENNICIDLLARLAVIKLLRAELAGQFTNVLERCRAKLKTYDQPKEQLDNRAVEIRERVAAFHLAKKSILRRASQDTLETLRAVERESLGPARISLFGKAYEAQYELLLNTLLFTDDGRDDFVNAEHYVMLGNYDRDPDRFRPLNEIAIGFLESLGFGSGADGAALDALLNVPGNAQELLGAGDPSEAHPKYREQKTALAAWVSTLEDEEVIDHVIAAYAAVDLLPEYGNTINPQQLKNALIFRNERKVVERLIEEHGRVSTDNFLNAVKRVSSCYGAERARLAGKFLLDFMRYHRDMRRLEALNGAMDTVNLLATDRLRELSSINSSLYEFLLPEEQKPAADKVISHVIIKADVRDSTLLTRTLFERGLNPASYFSLNFYDPVNKLLSKYGAQKVFIEGDAVILALFEREGEAAIGVAYACTLAREIIGIVRAYNEQSQKANLPTLELGIGITFQDSAPMYLMDGNSQIMISSALNESDRLSSCSKSARKMLAGVESLFNVFCFQTIADADTAGQPEEFLMRYNIGGINLNEVAFRKLAQEIALVPHELAIPTLWEEGPVKLYSGAVALSPGVSHPLVIRESRIPHIDARDFNLIEWTDRKYYEVCTNETIYEYVEQVKTAASAVATV